MVKQKWSKLTDEDLTNLGGNQDQLAASSSKNTAMPKRRRKKKSPSLKRAEAISSPRMSATTDPRQADIRDRRIKHRIHFFLRQMKVGSQRAALSNLRTGLTGPKPCQNARTRRISVNWSHFFECAECRLLGKAVFMNTSSWFVGLERQKRRICCWRRSLERRAAAVLYQIGLIGWVLRGLGLWSSGAIRKGFLLWERLLAWASWPLFLAIVFGFLVAGLDGRWFVAGLEGRLRPGPAVHGNRRLPGLHVHRPGTK